MEKYPAPRMGTEEDVIVERFIAFVIDSVLGGIVSVIPVIIGVGLMEASAVLGSLFVLVGLAVSIVYGFLLEGMYGYKPGKYLMGLVVVKSDGSNCTIGASIIRNLLLIVDQLPFLYLVGIALIFLTDRNQRVGDLVADTVVVEQR